MVETPKITNHAYTAIETALSKKRGYSTGKKIYRKHLTIYYYDVYTA